MALTAEETEELNALETYLKNDKKNWLFGLIPGADPSGARANVERRVGELRRKKSEGSGQSAAATPSDTAYWEAEQREQEAQKRVQEANQKAKQTTPQQSTQAPAQEDTRDFIADSSYATVAKAKPGQWVRNSKGEAKLTQADIDWANAQLKKSGATTKAIKSAISSPDTPQTSTDTFDENEAVQNEEAVAQSEAPVGKKTKSPEDSFDSRTTYDENEKALLKQYRKDRSDADEIRKQQWLEDNPGEDENSYEPLPDTIASQATDVYLNSPTTKFKELGEYLQSNQRAKSIMERVFRQSLNATKWSDITMADFLKAITPGSNVYEDLVRYGVKPNDLDTLRRRFNRAGDNYVKESKIRQYS